MNDELEWQHAMQEAVDKDLPVVIRRLFATIVCYCPVKDKQCTYIFFQLSFNFHYSIV